MPAAPSRPHSQARAVSDRFGRMATAALYGSLALIGAVVFGTLSLHPF